MVLLASSGSLLFYKLFRSSMLEMKVLLLLSVAFPAVLGLVAGLLIRGRHMKLYSLLGAFIGVIDYVGVLLIYRGMLWPLPYDWLEALLVICVGQTVLFLLSAIVGDWIEGRLFKRPLSTAAFPRVALVLAQLATSRKGDLSKNIELWKVIVGALTPILALIGTIVMAYFTYLAALTSK
jgi:hypothetical protein